MTLGRACLLVYILLFAFGGSVHLFHILQGGWLPYTYVPDWINAYWTSLALFDFVAIILLLRWRRAGLVASLLIMVSDVAVNTYAHNLTGGNIYWGYVGQVMFLGFIIGTFGFLWRGEKS